MSIYRIERCEIRPNRIRSEILDYFIDLDRCNGKIRDYAEAWRKEARLIQHHAGQSVVFFKDYRVEFTRLPSVSQT